MPVPLGVPDASVLLKWVLPSDDGPEADKALLLLAAIQDEAVREASPSPLWLAKTLKLTRRYEVSFYDAAYHALARIHKGLFVTAGSRYVNRVMEPGSVITLSECQPPLTPPPRRRRTGSAS